MRLLLDTHIALWAVSDDPLLPVRARELIEDVDNDILVSVASLWEIAIKHRAQPSRMQVSAAVARDRFSKAGYFLLDISPDHVASLESLPLLHKDPFDRMLIAQAFAVPLRLVTRDPKVAAYSDTIIHV